jgi:5-formyltetrahydrofolate cyclo-ligase
MSHESISRRELRLKLLAMRDASGPHQRQVWDARICDNLIELLTTRFGNLGQLRVGAYHPLGSEPDLRPVFLKFGELALPKVVARDGPLTFLAYREGAALTTQDFGVMVPVDERQSLPEVLIIPCVGFHVGPEYRIDRLGYGGGFYDRTLATRRYLTVGVAYSLARLDSFQPQHHDRPLDFIVTELGVTKGTAAD